MRLRCRTRHVEHGSWWFLLSILDISSTNFQQRYTIIITMKRSGLSNSLKQLSAFSAIIECCCPHLGFFALFWTYCPIRGWLAQWQTIVNFTDYQVPSCSGEPVQAHCRMAASRSHYQYIRGPLFDFCRNYLKDWPIFTIIWLLFFTYLKPKFGFEIWYLDIVCYLFPVCKIFIFFRSCNMIWKVFDSYFDYLKMKYLITHNLIIIRIGSFALLISAAAAPPGLFAIGLFCF